MRTSSFLARPDDSPSSPRKLCWGIIGTGVIAEHFAGDLTLARTACPGSIWSRSSDKRADFAARHGLRAHGSLAELLADADIDAVYIATPNETHAAFAEAAIMAGKAVLVEKPLARNPAEAERIVALAAARGVFLMEGMWTRFLPAMTFVREVIRRGELGDILGVEAELAFPQAYSAHSRFFDPARGGGSLLDLGVYGISLCLDLFGAPQASGGSWRAAPGGVDMSARVELRYGTMTATVSSAFDRTGANLFVITGSRRSLVLQPPFNAVRMVVSGAGGPALALARAGGNGLLARLARKSTRVLPLPGLARQRFDFAGHGLHFEADAVGEALAAGRTAHARAMPADSLQTLRIIEGVLATPPVA
jgi:predicted dehydrogenase